MDLALKERYPHQYWSISEKKTYCNILYFSHVGPSNRFPIFIAGVAILSKHQALSVDMTLPGHPTPNSVKGRIVTLEFETCYLIGTYVVNAGEKLKVSQMNQTSFLISNIYFIDLGRKKGMEHAFRHLPSRFRQKEACYLDR